MVLCESQLIAQAHAAECRPASTNHTCSTALINQWDGCPAEFLWADDFCAGGSGFLGSPCPADKGALLGLLGRPEGGALLGGWELITYDGCSPQCQLPHPPPI